MEVKFPLFAFEKDDRSMYLMETPERLRYFEAIDIENNEYLFWDSTGAGVCVSVANRTINEISHCDQAMSLSEAFGAYAQSHGIQFSSEEYPINVWRSIQSQLPPKRTLWARLFRKSKT